jgi:uncharacterized protein (TIGR01777 family)
MPVFEWRSALPVPADDVYAWHARPGAFERLVPPWQRLKVVERTGGIDDGGVLVFEYREGPLRGRWVAIHEGAEPGRRFVDRQVHGPFEYWQHTHSFIPQGPAASILEDSVDYGLPLGGFSDVVGGGISKRALRRLFVFRHRRTRTDLLRHAAVGGAPRLRVAVSGAGGLIGRDLVPFLTAGGHDVARMVRSARVIEGDIVWDPELARLNAASLEGLDAVVHLAGESISSRWTDERKHRILASRRDGTRLLAETVVAMKRPPKVIVSASAVGYYGDRGGEELTEESAAGDGFLAEVVREWEAALEPAREAGVRVVSLRFGIVVTAGGGALTRLLPAFRAGAGGPIGDGSQWWSWVALDDLLGAVLKALTDDSLSGPVNVVAPEPVTNREFARTLGRVLRRPAVVPVPRAAVRRAFGEMGDEMLLAGQRALPEKLERAGFRFDYPFLEEALRFELGKTRS